MAQFRRPENWNEMTVEEQDRYLRSQSIPMKGGRHRILTKDDAPQVWRLMKQTSNKSLVGKRMGVNRRTIIRFLKRHPIPTSYVLEDDTKLEDFPEIQLWFKRMKKYAGADTISNYSGVLRQFFEWMKEFHSERAKPSMWTSDDITEYIFGNVDAGGTWKGFKPYQWHSVIVPLRSLALKVPKEFPHIDEGELPTKKTHKAKRSLAGVSKYYLESTMIVNMIYDGTEGNEQESRDRALIALLFNVICRTGALTKIKLSDIKLENHFVKIIDKGEIIWHCYGLSEETCNLIRIYLEERGYPKTGYLFTNDNGGKLKQKEVNDIIRAAGEKVGVTGKVLTAKVFRKSLVKYALTPIEKGGLGMSPLSLVGTGKNIKTCFCVGWTDIRVLFQYYAPELMGQIEIDRHKFHFKETEKSKQQLNIQKTVTTKLKEIMPNLNQETLNIIASLILASQTQPKTQASSMMQQNRR